MCGEMLSNGTIGALDRQHDELAEEIEDDGDPDEALFSGFLDVYATYPEGKGDQGDGTVTDHATADHRNHPGVPAEAECDEEAGSEVESYKRCVSVFEGCSHICGEAQQACQDEEDGAAAQDVVRIEPRDEHADV